MIILLTTTLVGRSAESIHARLLAEGRAVIRAVDAIITRVALAFVWTAAVAVYAVCLANRHAGVCVDPGLLVTRIAAAYPRSTAITIHASLSADRLADRAFGKEFRRVSRMLTFLNQTIAIETGTGVRRSAVSVRIAGDLAIRQADVSHSVIAVRSVAVVTGAGLGPRAGSVNATCFADRHAVVSGSP